LVYRTGKEPDEIESLKLILAMIKLPPICFSCKHFDIEKLNCPAFPEQIPDKILDGSNNHKKPVKGQKTKIVFEPIDESEKLKDKIESKKKYNISLELKIY
jgi:hypothetical protein